MAMLNNQRVPPQKKQTDQVSSLEFCPHWTPDRWSVMSDLYDGF